MHTKESTFAHGAIYPALKEGSFYTPCTLENKMVLSPALLSPKSIFVHFINIYVVILKNETSQRIFLTWRLGVKMGQKTDWEEMWTSMRVSQSVRGSQNGTQ